ncbi:MAG TPA: GntR family transcriptional regulator [Rugosimonospora sp.]|nr:GntR family transcriptional regulator [Rugosimonospora sp.]
MAAEDGGPAPVDRRSPLPLWAQVAADLRRRLTAGAFSQGFPPEHDLVAQYGVSRHTVREALRELRTTGVVVAERGRRSFVDRSRIEQPLGALYSLFRAVEAQGVQQRSEVLRLRRTTNARVARHLRLAPGADLVELRRRRLVDGEPLALDTAWLPADLAAPLVNVDFTHTALYDELARRCGVRVEGGREQITPVVPDARSARLLGLQPGAAAFSVQRLGCAGGRPVEWRETTVRGDRFAFVAEWSARRPELGLSAEQLPEGRAR